MKLRTEKLSKIISEYENLYEREFMNNGKKYIFFGIVDASDDYYYGMIDENEKLRLSSCCGSLEQLGYKLLENNENIHKAQPDTE